MPVLHSVCTQGRLTVHEAGVSQIELGLENDLCSALNDFLIIPAIAGMHGPHSLVRSGNYAHFGNLIPVC